MAIIPVSPILVIISSAGYFPERSDSFLQFLPFQILPDIYAVLTQYNKRCYALL
jgi:hypothetical protein